MQCVTLTMLKSSVLDNSLSNQRKDNLPMHKLTHVPVRHERVTFYAVALRLQVRSAGRRRRLPATKDQSETDTKMDVGWL